RADERRPMEVLAAEVLVPRVDVRIELHQREGPVLLRGRAQQRQRDRMVAADHERRGTRVVNGRRAGFDDLERALDADGRHIEVAVVDDAQAFERVDLEKVAPRADERRLIAHLTWREPCAWPIRRAAVVRRAADGDIDAGQVARVRQTHERRRLREPRRLERRERAYARIHLRTSGRFGALPCIRMPTRKMRPAAHTRNTVAARTMATEAKTCQSGGPGGIASRIIITNGVTVGNIDMPTASGESGERTMAND